MAVAVIGRMIADRVSAGQDRLHERRLLLSLAADHKKCGVGGVMGEQFQNFRGGACRGAIIEREIESFPRAGNVANRKFSQSRRHPIVVPRPSGFTSASDSEVVVARAWMNRS